MNPLGHIKNTGYLEIDSVDSWVDNLVKELNNPQFNQLDDLIDVCKKYDLNLEHHDICLRTIKSVNYSLLQAIDRISSENGLLEHLSESDWDHFYFSLYNSLQLNKCFDQWQTSVFLLIDEVYEHNPEADQYKRYLLMLFRLSTMKFATSGDNDSLKDLRNDAPAIAVNMLIAYLKDSAHKEVVAEILLTLFSKHPKLDLTLENVEIICQPSIEQELSISTFIDLLRCCSELQSIGLFIFEVFLEKLLRVEKIPYDYFIVFVQVFVSLDLPAQSNEFCEKAAGILNKTVEDEAPCDKIFHNITYELFVQLSCLWSFQKEKNYLAGIGHENFFMVYMEWFHQLFSTMNTGQAIERFSFLIEICRHFNENFEKFNYLIAKSSWELLNRCLFTYPNLLSEEFDQFAFIDFLKQRDVYQVVDLQLVKKLFLFSYKELNIAGKRVCLKKYVCHFLDIFSFKDADCFWNFFLSVIVLPQTLEEFEELMSMISEIEAGKGFKVDDWLEEYYVSCFSNEAIPINLKVRIVSWLAAHRCLSQTQYSKLCLAVCHQVKWKRSILLNEFSDFLDFLLCGSKLPKDSFEQLTREQKAQLVDALKVPLIFPNFFAIYQEGEGLPHVKYLNPYSKKLENIMEFWGLEGHNVVEQHYAYWNAALVDFFTKKFHQFVKKKKNKKTSKKLGIRNKIMKRIIIRKSEEFRKEFILLGNYCCLKLHGNPLSENCRNFVMDW